MTDTANTTEHASSASAGQPLGGEQRAAAAESTVPTIVELEISDPASVASHGASMVVQLATLSFLVEKLDISVDDIEHMMTKIRTSAVASGSALFASQDVGDRLDLVVNILGCTYQSIAPVSAKEAQGTWRQ